MQQMKRWVVVFRSSPSPSGEVDATAADVRAPSHLAAIASARRTVHVDGPWEVAIAMPWPRGCRCIDVAADAAIAMTA